MNTQPEALRLSAALSDFAEHRDEHKASVELRRLHEANQAMLEALKNLLQAYYNNNVINADCFEAEAAIAKGEQK